MNIFIISIFFFWRVFLFFVAWTGEKFLPFSPRFPYSDILLITSHLPSWLWSFANFDGVHYLTIAKSSYSAQFTQVFFPLYPILVGIISKLFPILNLITVGLIVSNLSFFLSLEIFFKLLKLDYKKSDIKIILLFLISFPTSFYFGSFYSESVFLFFILCSFYLARTKRWWLSGFFGAAASATRLVGIFLLPALLWEWHQNEFKVKSSKYKVSNFHSLLSIFRSPITYLVPLGLIIYMLYLQINFGDFLYFWHSQPIFGAERSGSSIILLPQVIVRYIRILILVDYTQEIYWIALLELLITVFAFTALIIGHIRKVRLSYLIFSWLTVLTPTLTGTFSSMPRYVLLALPMYIVLGLIKNRLSKICILAVFISLLLFLTVLFTRGHWVG